MERSVKIRHDHELYVVTTDPGGGVTSYGFDYVHDRIERLTLAFGELDIPEVARGSMEAWDTMVNLQERAKHDYDVTGEQCVADLTPGLSGLEGHRIEVVDQYDETRRFVVGKSTGWIPVHLELPRKDSSGGTPCPLDGYKSIRDLGPVR